jgi:hypothetical protein
MTMDTILNRTIWRLCRLAPALLLCGVAQGDNALFQSRQVTRASVAATLRRAAEQHHEAPSHSITSSAPQRLAAPARIASVTGSAIAIADPTGGAGREAYLGAHYMEASYHSPEYTSGLADQVLEKTVVWLAHQDLLVV